MKTKKVIEAIWSMTTTIEKVTKTHRVLLTKIFGLSAIGLLVLAFSGTPLFLYFLTVVIAMSIFGVRDSYWVATMPAPFFAWSLVPVAIAGPAFFITLGIVSAISFTVEYLYF
jgi:hypothetical protein